MNMQKKMVLVAMGLAMACGAATGASAETRWDRDHPRQHQVLTRVAHQEHRITRERREGEIGARKAHRLRAADVRILRQERRDARMHGGHITRAEQHHLNRAENRVSRHIGA
ncbi:hypothetical protein [Phenylobacterium montanum]|uniref:Lipoprotein n=1 Tax=Phenylobacterium montanum TaxID=2823693 RepID=A0A975G1R0_9CAUL|nr:hypothetical protein [Caulobacter sp. S6]QUD89121.1 hypothetical protein KCG34_04335 [Caulobacter sp. S6]